LTSIDLCYNPESTDHIAHDISFAVEERIIWYSFVKWWLLVKEQIHDVVVVAVPVFLFAILQSLEALYRHVHLILLNRKLNK